jgi:hypothetical protein
MKLGQQHFRQLEGGFKSEETPGEVEQREHPVREAALVEDAWKASATSTVGWPNINVADIESGKVILTRDSYGSD